MDRRSLPNVLRSLLGRIAIRGILTVKDSSHQECYTFLIDLSLHIIYCTHSCLFHSLDEKLDLHTHLLDVIPVICFIFVYYKISFIVLLHLYRCLQVYARIFFYSVHVCCSEKCENIWTAPDLLKGSQLAQSI